MNRCAATLVATALLCLVGCGSRGGGGGVAGANAANPTPPQSLDKRHVIIMIADGWGYQHIAATKSYSGVNPPYAGFDVLGMTTWDLDTERINGSPAYDPYLAWNQPGYLTAASTDSASSATAMFTGQKTDRGRISVGPGMTGSRLKTVAEIAHDRGLAVGTVTSVPLSHATPAAWTTHNDSRTFYRVIADELLFGDPAATGSPDGSHGITGWVPDVLLSGGHPCTTGEKFMTFAQRALARSPGSGWEFVEGWDEDGIALPGTPARLLLAAQTANRLLGVFGGDEGNLPFALHDRSGQDPDQPTLAEMAEAALTVLETKPGGFALMIEGGAIDWAGHDNDMSAMIGEMLEFDDAVRTVVSWIEDPNNGSDWSNTLLIVTGDHETGMLTKEPGLRAEVPLGTVTPARMRAEKWDFVHKVFASWNDANNNRRMELGQEEVYWTWNTRGHSNALVPCYFKGAGAHRFQQFVEGTDPVRGDYLDNVSLFDLMLAVIQ